MEQFGPYELMERIAVGGMAEIFLARRCGPGGFAKLFALKRVLPELARQGEFREMFADEARLCASLSHPGLVQVFDYGEVDDTPFLAMEWIDGCDLTSLVETGGPLPVEAATFIMAEVARALTYVHEARDDKGKSLNIVHRDLSPGNIMISKVGDVKLGDFGVAKARGRLARTEAGQLKGTLAYLAPEQVSGSHVDARTDVYAIGLLLFELLTGERYIQGDNEVELLKAAGNPARRSAAERCDQVPKKLDTLLERALSLEADRRYPNAGALEIDLRRYCPETSGARTIVEQRVNAAKGSAPRRRQTEMLCCVEPDESPRKGQRNAALAIALVLLGLSLIGLGLWRFFFSSEEDRGIVSVPMSDHSGPPTDSVQEHFAPTNVHPSQDDGGLEVGPSHTTDLDAAPLETGTKALAQATVDRPRHKTAHRPPPERTKEPEEEPEEPSVDTSPDTEKQGPDLSALLRGADQRRRGRGLLSGDDQTADQLRTRAADLISREAPSSQSTQAITAYRQRVDEVAIDRTFIDRKMQRVSRRIATLDGSSPLATELSALSQQALRRAMGGDYEGANRILNQILARARR